MEDFVFTIKDAESGSSCRKGPRTQSRGSGEKGPLRTGLQAPLLRSSGEGQPRRAASCAESPGSSPQDAALESRGPLLPPETLAQLRGGLRARRARCHLAERRGGGEQASEGSSPPPLPGPAEASCTGWTEQEEAGGGQLPSAPGPLPGDLVIPCPGLKGSVRVNMFQGKGKNGFIKGPRDVNSPSQTGRAGIYAPGRPTGATDYRLNVLSRAAWLAWGRDARRRPGAQVPNKSKGPRREGRDR